MAVSLVGGAPPPSNPLVCFTCKGKGRAVTPCNTCGGSGALQPEGFATFYCCHDCGNVRCHVCGGDGRAPTPDTRKMGFVK